MLEVYYNISFGSVINGGQVGAECETLHSFGGQTLYFEVNVVWENLISRVIMSSHVLRVQRNGLVTPFPSTQTHLGGEARKCTIANKLKILKNHIRK